MKRLCTAVGANELLAMLGLGLMAAGIAMLSVPAALIVSGVLIFSLAVWPLLRAPREK
jgi:uncharacterized membrane-anchored protein YitT (DUF2179 family)